MASRREEERNEKIIRGLMKLPPNRKCINCNSLGPQYVCTNFWTFVCMTCSGIHREFTHRVKSVSMAKFTTQEVEALQNGGNQRAREAYLKDWDPQNQRFPNSSNADKVREFIKNVYVDKKYAGGKNSEKPPRDVQSMRSQEEETRRASSYHSYSQSPPYDYQYEERRYGKPGAALTRKPGSDRGLYDRKISSFVYSPGRRGEQVHEDMFANEGSGARVSDYSASSGGALSPNFQRATGYGSPPLQPPRSDSSSNLNRQTSNLSSEANFRSGADRIPQRQRTSSGSFGSFDSNSMSIKSFNSGSLADVPEPEMVHGTQQDTVSTVSQSATPGSFGLDPFQVPSGAKTAASAVDLFQAPAAFSSPSLDLFQSSTLPVPPIQNQIPQAATPTPVDHFADFPQHSLTSEKAVPEPSLPKNEGWATFDSPQPSASTSATAISTYVEKPTIKGDTTENIDMLSCLNSWPSLKESPSQNSPSDVSRAWDDNLVKAQAPTIMSNVQPWNAFGEASLSIPSTGINQIDEPPAAISGQPILDQYSAYEDFSGIPKSTVATEPHSSAQFPFAAKTLSSHGSAAGYKSSNPFDFPFDTDTEQCNMFFDMTSLQAALPEPQLPSSLLGGVSDPWFPQDTVTPYASTAPHGGLAYLAGQAATPIPNVPVQGPLASVGGNPFA